jgi:hypothetical protein
MLKDNGEVPIVILAIPFDRLDSNALVNGLVTSDGNYLYSTPGSASPFIQEEFYGAALAVDLLDTNAFEVVLPTNLIFNQFEKSITHIEVDFSDGLGPRTLLPNQTLEVTYDPTDYGFKPIIYKIYFNDNTWVTTHGGVTLKYKYDSEIPGTADIPAGDVFDITAEHPFAGKFGKAKITIAYGDKLCAVSFDGSRTYYEGGTFKGNKLNFKTRSLGQYAITYDDEAPKLTPLVMGRNFKFRVSDNLSGVAEITCSLDDKWILSEYEPKTGRIWGEIPKWIKPGAHEFKLIVKDSKGNQTEYKKSLTL